MRAKRFAATVAAVALSLPFLGLAPTASAHVDNPTVTALHAFLGDPLFGLGTAEGTLFATLPDDQTAQASTTKLMTLHLTVIALNDGIVDLDDLVTINAVESGIGGSMMTDVNGVTLEVGEVVSLEDLIRGMMYHSGNDAAWAIARHVAEGYLGAGATAADFVAMMNAHAVADGLVDTSFANPNGFDDPNHFTTARELAMNIEHAIQDPYFQEVVGFVGTWNATTQGPNGPKMYVLNFPFFTPFAGYEGAKGGGTPNCNGPNNGCMAMSGKQIGRRIVMGCMQGQPWAEETGLFQYGFATIFHPDPRGASVSAGGTEKHDVACLTDGRAVSAAYPPTGDARLVTWVPDVDASTIAKLAEATLPKSGNSGSGQGPERDVAVTQLPAGDVIVATRKGSSVDLSRWAIAGNGTPTLLESDIKAGPGVTMALQSVSGDTFLTVMADPEGDLVVKSWRLESGGGIEQLDTYRDETRPYIQVAIADPLNTDVYNGHRATTAAATNDGFLAHHVWAVDSGTGTISRLGELVEPTGIFNGKVALSPLPVETVSEGELFPPVYYATAFWNAGGFSSIRFYRIAPSGIPVNEGIATSTATDAFDVRVAPLGVAGVIQSVRDEDGDNAVELTVFEAARQEDNSIVPDLVSEHAAPATLSPDLCRVPSTHAEGDYIVASLDPADAGLRLRAYRSGDRPY
jgi:D-alanyl-D-alanine carboxypeptidase